MKQRIKLQASALAVGYEGVPVVREVDFVVRSGEICSLIGPNGAGKSTLLKSMAGQLEPVAGTVFLDGRNRRQIPGAAAAKKLAFLQTGRPEAEWMSCRDVAAAGRYPYTGRLGVLTGADWERVDEALRQTASLDLADLPFDSISDGQKQRVLLARALCQEPEVLLLDEPTSFLDIRHKLELLVTLRKLAQERQLAILLSLHELELARSCSDRLLCLKGGAVDRMGTPEEIFSGDYIAGLYGVAQSQLRELLEDVYGF